MRLSRSIEKPGFFWLPRHPDQHYPGNLHISEAGEITLSIVHRPTTIDSRLLHSKTPIGDDPPRIVGIVDNNQVTLQGCAAVDDPFYLCRIAEGGVSVSQFRIGAAFIGISFPDEDPISFSRVECSFESLSEWFSISGFRPEINADSQPAKWELHYVRPDNITITLPRGIQLSFVFDPSFSLPDYKTSQLSSGISQQIHVSLTSAHPLPFVEFFGILHRIQTFLCLVMNKVTSLEWVRGYLKDKLNEWGREIPTDIFYRSQLHVQHQNELHTPMLYRYSDIAEELEATFLKWFESYETIQPAFDLYLSSKIGAYKYLTGVFLSLAQALETLHRRTSNETAMESHDFDRLHGAIVEAIPLEKVDFIKYKLKYANEISLRKRLKRLIEPFRDLFGTSSEINLLVQNAVDIRNYLTHYDKEEERRTKEVMNRDLHDICLKLEALLQLQFLQFTGMDVNRIKSIASGNHVLRRRLALDDSDA